MASPDLFPYVSDARNGVASQESHVLAWGSTPTKGPIMATYAITFELKSDHTYVQRYQTLMEQIRACERVWTETTSFALVESREGLSTFESRLYCQSEFNSLIDKMLVIDVTNDPGIFRGVNNMPATLGLLMPNVLQK